MRTQQWYILKRFNNSSEWQQGKTTPSQQGQYDDTHVIIALQALFFFFSPSYFSKVNVCSGCERFCEQWRRCYCCFRAKAERVTDGQACGQQCPRVMHAVTEPRSDRCDTKTLAARRRPHTAPHGVTMHRPTLTTSYLHVSSHVGRLLWPPAGSIRNHLPGQILYNFTPPRYKVVARAN